MNARRRPALSIVVAVFNMRREAMRTLRSLAPKHQLGMNGDEYEVLVVENGSTEPLDPQAVQALGPMFRYFYVDTKAESPVAAMKQVLGSAQGELIGVSIDGARIFSPGMLALARQACSMHEHAVCSTMSWHLGPDVQWNSILQGYSKDVEDRLLDGVGWPADGYRLFEIAVPAGSSECGCFRPIAESNCLFLRQATLAKIGGLDDSFHEPGGGLANHDLYHRASTHPDCLPILLLGEATFHQLHGGVSTNADAEKRARLHETFQREYEQLRGARYQRPLHKPLLFGRVPTQLEPWLHRWTAPASPPSAVESSSPAWRWVRRLLRSA